MKSSLSVLHVAAMFRAAKYRSKKVVETKDGDKATVYEYGPRQVQKRNKEKAARIQKLREIRSGLIERVRKDFKSKDPKTRLTALAVALIDHTYERVGNPQSAQEGHYGVTEWRKKHVSFTNGKAKLTYTGKSGVKQTKEVKDKAAVALLRELAKDKGPEDPILTCDDGEVCITSKDVNAYLPEGITAKDLRGLHANKEMLEALRDIRAKGSDLPRDRKARDKILKAEFKKALGVVSKIVGHEASTLNTHYLVPDLEEAYMKDGTVLQRFDKAATKTPAEREDEEARKLLRPEPKKKPPRRDLRNTRMEEEDPDLVDTTVEGDKDRSRNYKKIARLYLANKAKSEEAAQKMFEEYRGKNPDTKKTWQDFYEEPEKKDPAEDDPKGKKQPAEGDDAPADEPKAQEVARKKLVKDSLNQATSALKKLQINLPKDLKGDIQGALDNFTPEQIDAFNGSVQEFGERVRGLPRDGKGAIRNAERTLKTLGDIDWSAEKDPAMLARNLVELSHAQSVLDAEEKSKKGRAKKVSDTINQLEEMFAGDNEKYRLPRDLRTVLDDQLSGFDESQLEEVVSAARETLTELEGQETDTEDAVELARETLEDYTDALDSLGNPSAKGGQIADIIHARNILDREADREKANVKAQKAALKQTARIFRESKLPREISGTLQGSLERFDATQLADYEKALREEQAKIDQQIRRNPETGEMEFAPQLLQESIAALRIADYGKKPKDVARQAALAMIAHTQIANPFNLGGQEVGSKDLSAQAQRERGQSAFDQYRHFPHDLRVTAAKKIQQRLENIDSESSEAKELNRILDGITLAALVDERNEKGTIPQIPGREVNEGFAELARSMAQEGKVGLLLGPVEDFYSSHGQQEVHKAMQGMSDEALSKAVKTHMPDMERYLVGERDGAQVLSQAKKDLLRGAVIDIAIDNMSVMDRVLKSRLEETGDTKFDDPEYRASRMNKVRKSMGSDWWDKLFAKWLKVSPPPVSPEGKAASLDLQWGSFVVAKDENLPPEVGLRLEVLKTMDELLSKEVGKSTESHSDRALKRFLETKNPDFLRSDPDPDSESVSEKKEARISRLFSDKGDNYTAGQPSVFAANHFFCIPPSRYIRMRQASDTRRGNMTTLTKEAAQEVTSMLDAVAEAIQKKHANLGIPSHIALDFAYRCDMLSDHLEKSASGDDSDDASDDAEEKVEKEAHTIGDGQGTSPGGDGNQNVGPSQPFNPAEIGKQVATPPVTQPDEAYMKKNFLQEEFNELRNWQQKGLFSNAKAASEAAGKMIAKLQTMQALLEDAQ